MLSSILRSASDYTWNLVTSTFEEKGMGWARMLAYITGTVDQEPLLRNEYLAPEN